MVRALSMSDDRLKFMILLKKSVIASSSNAQSRAGGESRRSSSGHRNWWTTSIAAVFALALCGGWPGGARALAAPPVDDTAVAAQPQFQKTYGTERQSLTNPFPNGGGDAQNRSRAGSDVYWGVTNGNVPWYTAPLARVPNSGEFVLGLDPQLPVLALDGWVQIPRLGTIATNGTLASIGTVFDYASGFGAEGTNPTTMLGYWQAITVDATGNTSTNVQSPGGPGTTGLGTTYFRALAVPRPTTPADVYPAAQKFAWRLQQADATDVANPNFTIPGAANLQLRYRIYVHIPEPATNENVEDRIDDARYTVYYYVLRTGGNAATATDYLPKHQTYILAQTAGGDQELLNPDGSEAFFPLFTSATFTTGFGATLPAQTDAAGNTINPPTYGSTTVAIQQGVALDNTTEDTGDSFDYVIADSLQLEQGLDRLIATPTVTPPHGGQKLAEFDTAERTAVGTPAVPFTSANYQPITDGVKKNQKRSLPAVADAVRQHRQSAGPGRYSGRLRRRTGWLRYPRDLGTRSTYYATATALPNFVNDPLDPLYDRNNTTFNPSGYDTPSYALESWNPTTLFEGPNR